MSIRAYKVIVAVLLCISLFLAWRCWVLFGQQVAADFIEKQCRFTQESFIDGPPDTEALAARLEFLMGYYSAYSKELAGSHLERIVRRDYEQTLTNALAVFRREATNDLGSDPRAWIQKYGK